MSAAVQKRTAQGRQKRSPRGNREDSRRAMGHARLLCGACGKASRRLEGRFNLSSQRRGEPFPGVLVARNPKSQPVWSVCERAGEDSCGQQPLEGGARVGGAQPVEKASVPPMIRQPARCRRASSRAAVLAEAPAHCLEPIRIGERADPDRNRRPADRPRAKGGPQGRDDVWRGERETETQPGQSIGFAERAQHDRPACGQG